MLHAGGVNKKTLKKKHKIEKAMATIKVVTNISVYTYLRNLTKLAIFSPLKITIDCKRRACVPTGPSAGEDWRLDLK